MSQTQYTIRTQSNRAYTYGLGEVISDGITLFRDGCYDLTQEELNKKIVQLKAFKVEAKQ